MRRIVIGAGIAARQDVFERVCTAAGMPSNSIRNLDALFDVLRTDLEGPIELVWQAGRGGGLDAVLRVLQDVAAERDDVRLVLEAAGSDFAEDGTRMRFTDKTVIVTGSAQGIGRACVEAFAAEGAKVVIADVDVDKGESFARELHGRGVQALFQQTDVGDKASVQAMVDAAVRFGGGLDVLVNNAGIIRAGEFLELDEADFDLVLRVNLKGSFLCGQAAARVMAAQGKGAIVNMSSVNGVLAIPNQTPYNVSKGGMNQLTNVMALALADKGVRVNGVGPGSILTDMLKTIMVDEAARTKVLARTPLGRCGEPEEVARVVLFLASEDAAYVTGQTVYVDGGRLGLNYTVPVQG
ncbi:glucose 1-dehydrogenase [Geminicoccus roseus]|uniref:glucose 1-dehydrogenase n=1 Tax=Geminicoccus roseus TaxID=404900 RepID=UPI000426EE25|nr:glucose 1-dehydrogenase [Geminicoccus roseus]